MRKSLLDSVSLPGLGTMIHLAKISFQGISSKRAASSSVLMNNVKMNIDYHNTRPRYKMVKPLSANLTELL